MTEQSLLILVIGQKRVCLSVSGRVGKTNLSQCNKSVIQEMQTLDENKSICSKNKTK